MTFGFNPRDRTKCFGCDLNSRVTILWGNTQGKGMSMGQSIKIPLTGVSPWGSVDIEIPYKHLVSVSGGSASMRWRILDELLVNQSSRVSICLSEESPRDICRLTGPGRVVESQVNWVDNLIPSRHLSDFLCNPGTRNSAVFDVLGLLNKCCTFFRSAALRFCPRCEAQLVFRGHLSDCFGEMLSALLHEQTPGSLKKAKGLILICLPFPSPSPSQSISDDNLDLRILSALEFYLKQGITRVILRGSLRSFKDIAVEGRSVAKSIREQLTGEKLDLPLLVLDSLGVEGVGDGKVLKNRMEEALERAKEVGAQSLTLLSVSKAEDGSLRTLAHRVWGEGLCCDRCGEFLEEGKLSETGIMTQSGLWAGKSWGDWLTSSWQDFKEHLEREVPGSNLAQSFSSDLDIFEQLDISHLRLGVRFRELSGEELFRVRVAFLVLSPPAGHCVIIDDPQRYFFYGDYPRLVTLLSKACAAGVTVVVNEQRPWLASLADCNIDLDLLLKGSGSGDDSRADFSSDIPSEWYYYELNSRRQAKAQGSALAKPLSGYAPDYCECHFVADYLQSHPRLDGPGSRPRGPARSEPLNAASPEAIVLSKLEEFLAKKCRKGKSLILGGFLDGLEKVVLNQVLFRLQRRVEAGERVIIGTRDFFVKQVLAGQTGRVARLDC